MIQSYIKDNFEYKDGELKTKIPTPTLCPEERCRKRYAFRNEKSLYKRKCSYSGNEIIWMFSPDKPYRVYENDFWRWDTWDPMDYWRSFNWKFDLIFKSLTEEVPVINVFVVWQVCGRKGGVHYRRDPWGSCLKESKVRRRGE